MNIRPFQYVDLDAVIALAQQSFAQDFIAQGMSLDGFTQQVRFATRGRMLPFKVLTKIAGIQWQFFVAEINGQIVGFGGYIGRKEIELNNLMVHPDFRRQGIGQALLERRLQHLTKLGYPYVTTTILESNVASLGNIQKQGFDIFDTYTAFEAPLPLPTFPKNRFSHRPFQATDTPVLVNMEQQLTSAQYLKLSGSSLPNYAPSFGERILNTFTGGQTYIQVFVDGGNPIGILGATAIRGQTKGGLFRPLVLDEHLDQLPMMLGVMSAWLTAQGKSAVRVNVPLHRTKLVQQLTALGWQQSHNWVRAYKNLNG